MTSVGSNTLPPGALQGLQGPTTTRCTIADIVDQDAMSMYTSLDDYDAMFEARHGRGAVDNSLAISEGKRSTSFPMTIPS